LLLVSKTQGKIVVIMTARHDEQLW